MTLIVHSPESLALASRRVFDAALPAAREGGVVGLVVVVVDAAERVHYHTSRNPTMTAGMLSVVPDVPTPDDIELDVIAGKAYEAALPVADEHCVGVALVVIDAAEHARTRSSVGRVLTAGMMRRTSVLFDITSMLPTFVPFAAVGGGHPGGGVAGAQTTATGGTGAASSTPAPDAPAAGSSVLGEGVHLDALNRGRVAVGMPPLTQAQLDERLASLPGAAAPDGIIDGEFPEVEPASPPAPSDESN